MVKAFAEVPPGTKIPWYGPPMSPASFATARLMEYWAHGQDVVDALGITREPTARLKHIAHLGVRTRGFSYAVRGKEVPEGEVRVTLTAPDGSTWEWGSGDDAIVGTAEDFCLRVTQRRHRADTRPAGDRTARRRLARQRPVLRRAPDRRAAAGMSRWETPERLALRAAGQGHGGQGDRAEHGRVGARAACCRAASTRPSRTPACSAPPSPRRSVARAATASTRRSWPRRCCSAVAPVA